MLFKLGSFEWRIAIGLAGILPVAVGYLLGFLRWKKQGSVDSAGVFIVTFAYVISFLFLMFLSFEFERFQTGERPLSHHVKSATDLAMMFFLPLPATIVSAMLVLLFWITPLRLPFLLICLFAQVLHFINLGDILMGGEGLLGAALRRD